MPYPVARIQRGIGGAEKNSPAGSATGRLAPPTQQRPAGRSAHSDEMRESEGKSAGQSVRLTGAPVNVELPRFLAGSQAGALPGRASARPVRRAAIDDLRGPVVVAAARPAVAAAPDMAAASAWPSAGSENPTMTWRVTPSPASSARRAATFRPRAARRAVWVLLPVSRPVSERSGRAVSRPFPTCRAAA